MYPYLTRKKNVRFSKKVKSELPPLVVEKIAMIKDRYPGIKTFSLYTVEDGYQIYFGEGDSFWVIQNDRCQHVEMVHSNILGASGVHYDIGAKVSAPAGTWILKVWYYNRYYLNVTNVVQKQITERAGK